MHQLPGTKLEGTNINCEEIFRSIFMAGGLVLSQVCTITGLESHTVQNWVKRKFVSPPRDKKYSQNQLCRIICINVLKDALSIDVICSLLAHINGVLANEADDFIEDSQLYFYFVQVVFQTEGAAAMQDMQDTLSQILASYVEPVPGAKKRLREVLEIMLMAHRSAQYKQQAMLLYKGADIGEMGVHCTSA